MEASLEKRRASTSQKEEFRNIGEHANEENSVHTRLAVHGIRQ
jgi:hypothetical protein